MPHALPRHLCLTPDHTTTTSITQPPHQARPMQISKALLGDDERLKLRWDEAGDEEVSG